MKIQRVVQVIKDGNFIEVSKAHILFKKEVFFKKVIKKYYQILPINKKKIVFDNFAGQGFGDHPRYIAEEIHRRKLNWDIVWLVSNMEVPMPGWVRKVPFGSAKAFWETATAGIWVDNIRNAHLLPKREEQIYLQTWHAPTIFQFKCVEKDDEDNLNTAYIKAAQYDGTITTGILSQCSQQTEMFQRAFWLSDKAEILEYGGPRVDRLFDSEYIRKRRVKLRKNLKIREEEFVILYAPTFRDDGSTEAYVLDFESIINVFHDKIGKDCRLIIRLHPNVRMYAEKLTHSESILDVSNYGDANDAIILADAVISDFSTIIYEACLLKRIIFRCAVDYDNYITHRRLLPESMTYPFLVAKSSEELIEQIHNTDLEAYWKSIEKYLQQCDNFDDGHSAKRTVDWLIKKTENF